MVPLKDVLKNNPLMMSIAFACGLLFGGFPEYNSAIINLALIVMMSVSLCNLNLRNLELRDHTRSTAMALGLSFALSSVITIGIAFLFEDPIRSGWIVQASVPSAVSVITFSFLLGGDVENSLISSATIYIASLLATPVILLAFIGKAVSPITLLSSVGLLIFLPLILSRGVRKASPSPTSQTIMVNLTFFFVIFAVIGSNRHAFFDDLMLIGALLLVSAFRIFFPGLLVEAIGKRWRIDAPRRVNMVLFTTYKNTGMAAALAISLVGAEAALPPAMCTPMEIIWLVVLSTLLYPKEGRT
ncbi:MAG: bile acid:sodium symporter family protein [Methanomassiliicoccales archaeon]